MLEGSCACGRVRYRIHGSLQGSITYCHCWRCRKHSGSSFGTTGSIKADEFEITEGGERLSFWESNPGIRRYFASCCGSPIYKANDESPDLLRLRLGTLDVDPGVHDRRHYMVGSKAPWFTIDDDLEQEMGAGPPFGARD